MAHVLLLGLNGLPGVMQARCRLVGGTPLPTGQRNPSATQVTNPNRTACVCGPEVLPTLACDQYPPGHGGKQCRKCSRSKFSTGGSLADCMACPKRWEPAANNSICGAHACKRKPWGRRGFQGEPRTPGGMVDRVYAACCHSEFYRLVHPQLRHSPLTGPLKPPRTPPRT